MARGDDGARRMDRRAFVKGCVGASAAAAVAGAGYAMTNPLNPLEAGAARVVEYIAAKKVGGPAPRGIPLLPLDVTDEGIIQGSPTLADASVLDWYKYCGHEGAPGLQEGFQGDEALTYFITPDKLAGGFDPWYRAFIGEPVRAEQFPDVGSGAAVSWRSEGQTGNDIITAIIIRVDPDRVAFEGVEPELVMQAGLAEGFIGFVSFCTHFCCVPGWQEALQQARAVGAEDDIFCTCHLSQYDPFLVTQNDFLLLGGGEEEVLETET